MNPLLNDFSTPFGTIPFGEINNEHFIPAVETGIKIGLEQVDKIVANTESPDFNNTIVALEKAGSLLERVLNVFFPLLSANADDEMMQISMRISPMLSDYSTTISLNTKLWERIKYVHDNTDVTSLSLEESMLLNETYEGFARSGALLEGENRERYKQISARLGELTEKFGQNVLKGLNECSVILEAEDLEGLPEHLVEEAALLAGQSGHEGKYRFTLQQPTYMAFMKHSKRRDLRERFYRLYSGRNINGEFSNIDIVKEIVSLRLEKAKLLGKDTYADFVLERTMAGSHSKVMELLGQLRSAYSGPAHAELREIADYASKLEGMRLELKPWDYSFYANKLKNHLYSYDEEQLRPYFQLENVIDGVFGLAGKLYGLTFVANGDIPVYHPDVKAFEVKDADGSLLGVLYADFFPRDSKRPGAWMTEFKPQWREDDGTDSRPHISIVMNFTKPTPSKPSLLTPDEVRTFLHEFGHALHGLLSKTRFASLSGTNVRRDFVELPSQFNENYLTQMEFLSGFARHYRTGQPITEELITQIVRSQQFGAAYACMRQLSFGLLDLAWHSVTESVDNVEAFERKAVESVKMFEPEVGALTSPQFSHIFAGGYAAGYYSYKWAEVLDADAFDKFKADGIFNTETARSFRTNILERGGTEVPAELYRRFRGADPSVEALMRRDGIATV